MDNDLVEKVKLALKGLINKGEERYATSFYSNINLRFDDPTIQFGLNALVQEGILIETEIGYKRVR